jgi:Flp pilus assembly protein TadB
MNEVELDIPQGTSRAVIEGKTIVPFKTFVSLILQRKVQTVFKKNQDDPVIVNSDLLTALASAPEDKQEDRGKLVLVTFAVGILAGIFLAVAVLLGLLLFQITPTMQDLGIVLGVIVGVAILGALLQKSQKKSGFKEKLYETMEKTTEMISR